MTDERLARLRAHESNINRYNRLLKTNLSELERGFLKQRLAEEKSAVARLTQADHFDEGGSCLPMLRMQSAEAPRPQFPAIRELHPA